MLVDGEGELSAVPTADLDGDDLLLEAPGVERAALDRMRLRQASRLFAQREHTLTRDDLTTIVAADIRASRVFADAAA